MADNETPPIVINPSVIRTTVVTVIGLVATLIGAAATVSTFVSNRDLAGFIVWMKSDDFLAVVGALTTLAGFAATVWPALKQKRTLVEVARRADDSVAVVTEPSPPPAVDKIVPALILVPLAALFLAGCATMQSPAAPRSKEIGASADATAAVLDAIGQAPPATLTKTTIDDKAIRTAFVVWDKGLTVIEAFIDSGAIKPGSPTALRIRRGVLATTDALNAASAAQRAGSAKTYSDALDKARLALTDIQLVLATR